MNVSKIIMGGPSFETNYYKLWTDQIVEGYNVVYSNEKMKLVRLDI